MSLTRYLIGVLLLAVVVLSVGGGARAARGRLLPNWSGPPALLADVVLSLSIVVGLAEILGAIGLFRLVPMVVGTVVSGCALWYWGRRPPTREPATENVARAPAVTTTTTATATGRRSYVVCVIAVAFLTASWATHTIAALRHGISNVDSIWYHLPIAARYVQEGAVTQVHYLDGGALTAFYPATTPLVHGFGMLLLGSDLLSPVLNLGFLALTLLAAWCLGRPFGVAPATLTGASVVLGTPMLVATQPGGAYNDVVGIGLVLAAVALLATGDPRRGPSGPELWIAALAAGLALGTKYQFIAPVIALTIGIVAIAPRGERVQRAVTWLLPLVVVGGFFYVRNFVAMGNPVPPIALQFGPISLPSPPAGVEELAPVAVLGDRSFWDPITLPALRSAFGPAWWVLLALVGAGVVSALALGRGLLTRMLGGVTLVALAGWVVSPASMGSKNFPVFFVYSLRYAAFALVLALVVLPLVPALGGRRSWYLVVVFGVVLAVTQLDPSIWPTELHQLRWAEPVRGMASGAAAAVGVAVVAIGLALVVVRGRTPGWRPPLLAAAVMGLGIVAAGAAVHDVYLRNRYANESYLPAVFRWGRQQHDERIAVVGTPLQYPLYGNDLSNHVQYVGERGRHGAFATITDCATWRRALNAGDYSYVLTATNPLFKKQPIEDLWTRRDPAAVVAVRDGRATVFRLKGRLDPSACRLLGERARAPADG